MNNSQIEKKFLFDIEFRKFRDSGLLLDVPNIIESFEYEFFIKYYPLLTKVHFLFLLRNALSDFDIEYLSFYDDSLFKKFILSQNLKKINILFKNNPKLREFIDDDLEIIEVSYSKHKFLNSDKKHTYYTYKKVNLLEDQVITRAKTNRIPEYAIEWKFDDERKEES